MGSDRPVSISYGSVASQCPLFDEACRACAAAIWVGASHVHLHHYPAKRFDILCQDCFDDLMDAALESLTRSLVASALQAATE
jgi:hypothetical protein